MQLHVSQMTVPASCPAPPIVLRKSHGGITPQIPKISRTSGGPDIGSPPLQVVRVGRGCQGHVRGESVARCAHGGRRILINCSCGGAFAPICASTRGQVFIVIVGLARQTAGTVRRIICDRCVLRIGRTRWTPFIPRIRIWGWRVLMKFRRCHDSFGCWTRCLNQASDK